MTPSPVPPVEWGVDVGTRAVHGWSSTRLAFQPRAEMSTYRDVLRRALRELRPKPGAALVARYAAADDAFVDVENAALYNIGAGAYAHLITAGLFCERVHSTDGRHHLAYLLVDPVPELPAGDALARLSISVPPRTDKPGGWWAAFRAAALRLPHPAVRDGPFTVELAVPQHWRPTTVANLIKPLPGIPPTNAARRFA